LNEERNLLRALESLRCCDEWIVVDSGSSDRTREIAEAFGAKVLHHDWQGYTKQKNFAARAAAYDWVLALDADEALSDELASEIEALKDRQAPALALTFVTDESGFANLSRYETGIMRGVLRTLHELQRLQSARLGGTIAAPVAVDVDVQVSENGH